MTEVAKVTARWLDHSIPLPHLLLDGPEPGGPAVVVTCGEGHVKRDLGYTSGGVAASQAARHRLADAFDLAPDRLVFMDQVHGSTVVSVGSAEAGAGMAEKQTALPGVDGMITGESNLALVGLSADCPLVALWGEGICGLAHCGWRGLAAGLISNVVAAMTAKGVAPEQMWAVVGPSIGPCCYEVGLEVAAALTRRGIGTEEHLRRDRGGTMADLPGVALYQLHQAGLPGDRTSASSGCTRCDSVRYHSYRRCGADAGRQAMAICRKGQWHEERE
jgi:purine-nucleoside/S-methyl-5'-thioadenosine phosphorylase / adenosine deaminase